jgi:outer membrane lipoprotein-sorting protein
MKRRAFLATPLALALARVALADAVQSALADVTKARAGLKTLVAPFTQERTIGLLATAVKSEGEVTLVRPDRLRWELKPPDAIVYFITPEGLAYSAKGGAASVSKAAAGRFGAVLGDLTVFLGGDLEKLRARYDLDVQTREGSLVLTARPKADDLKKLVKSIETTFAPELWAVRRVVIEETGGDRSVITFGKSARDVKVDPARMQPPVPRP